MLEDIVLGLAILKAYPDADIAAEHDIIYAGPNFDDVLAEDAKKLEQLGWFKDSECDCWAHFV